MYCTASSVSLGQLVGGGLGGLLGGAIGPKRTILLGVLPIFVGWLLIGLAPHISLLILGRLANGLGSTFLTANCALLITQYSAAQRRGAFLSLFTLMLSLGILVAYCLGAGLYWRYLTAVPAALSLLFAAGLCRIPESPIWLLGHRGREAARAALIWLRGLEDVEEELEDLLVRELWKPELFKEYKSAKEAEMRAKMAESDRLVDNLDNNSVMVDPDPHSYRF